ncbi:unnamed protein product [Schistosoma curassoni]|uniref:Uncharacterized protein n=1 Tax=Schistosoma curassoni TaxID=6186 RepID=A0A183JUM3_9TREM|nr:unnamed protein product [Schistosoma curassoni]
MAIRQNKSGKVAASDNIPPETLKSDMEACSTFYLVRFGMGNKCRQTEKNGTSPRYQNIPMKDSVDT